MFIRQQALTWSTDVDNSSHNNGFPGHCYLRSYWKSLFTYHFYFSSIQFNFFSCNSIQSKTFKVCHTITACTNKESFTLDCGNSSANALELPQFCSKPLTRYCHEFTKVIIFYCLHTTHGVSEYNLDVCFLQLCMSKRYDPATKSLNLGSFSQDDGKWPGPVLTGKFHVKILVSWQRSYMFF